LWNLNRLHYREILLLCWDGELLNLRINHIIGIQFLHHELLLILIIQYLLGLLRCLIFNPAIYSLLYICVLKLHVLQGLHVGGYFLFDIVKFIRINTWAYLWSLALWFPVVLVRLEDGVWFQRPLIRAGKLTEPIDFLIHHVAMVISEFRVLDVKLDNWVFIWFCIVLIIIVLFRVLTLLLRIRLLYEHLLLILLFG
jgi:hypothetical protein